jgi:hypothetical protein
VNTTGEIVDSLVMGVTCSYVVESKQKMRNDVSNAFSGTRPETHSKRVQRAGVF